MNFIMFTVSLIGALVFADISGRMMERRRPRASDAWLAVSLLFVASAFLAYLRQAVQP